MLDRLRRWHPGRTHARQPPTNHHPTIPQEQGPGDREARGAVSMAAYQYIYVMKNVSKIYPGRPGDHEEHHAGLPAGRQDRRARRQRRRQVDAAQDHGRASTRTSAARPGRPHGVKVGYLPQEPQLDPAKDVLGNVMEGVGPAKALLDRFNEVSDELRRPRRRHGRAAGRAGRAAGEDRRLQRLGARAHARHRHGRAALPAGRRRRGQALGRRAAARGPVPAAAVQPRHAAARRADQPSRRRIGGLARAVPGRVQEHRRGRHPRPLLPRQCRGLDPGARSRPRHPLRGQLHRLAGAEAEAAASRRSARSKARQRTLAREQEWIGQSPQARRAKSKARISAYEDLLARGARPGAGDRPDRDPARAAPGRPGDRGRGR